ncbi:MAG TPA: response regulator [Methylomirabilota bacterium]|nr:response regulator [Methylomirabilota bacterium]
MPKTKVLIADADPESRAALEKALIDGGYEVAAAPSGSFAVTMLEWERPDLVVSRARVEDMDGYELFALVRKDPTTMDTPFLLLAGLNRPIALAAAEAGVDMTMTGELTVDAVVGCVGELLARSADERNRQERRAEPAAGRRSLRPLWEAIEAAGPVPLVASAGAFQGSLGAMDLTEVTQAVALGGKTGCLMVSLTAGQGAILFENGRIVHAGFRGLTGEKAFAALLSAAQREAQARFCFNRADRAEVAHLPKTISRSVDQLLLSIAAGMDEAGADADGNQGASASPKKGEEQ